MTKRKLSNVDTIVIHCSATKASQDVDIHDVRKWHKAKGWSDVGYHFVVLQNGLIQYGRDITRQGAHVKGHNKTSIGICYIGGLDEAGKPKDTLTDDQARAISDLIEELVCHDELQITRLLGHRDFPGVAKACPCFDIDDKFFPEVVIHSLTSHLDES